MPPTPPGDSDRSRFNRQIDDAFTEASRLAGSTLAPTDFYEQFLTRALGGINAPAGAVWLRTPQGFLQVACQVNLEKVGLKSDWFGYERISTQAVAKQDISAAVRRC